MPDIERKTLSATQTPALFGASPYLTRWMLLRHFIHGDPIDDPGNNRMDWGSKLQPLVLAQAAADLHLEVRPNAADTYVQNDLLGCTRDAEVICPDRGPGALECKCVFDYAMWMQNWDGGKRPPRHIEIQLQQQMMVGDGTTPFNWGVLAVWVCGEMHYFERDPIEELWTEIRRHAQQFFIDVAQGVEGSPFGEEIELPLIGRLYPPKSGRTIDLTGDPRAAQYAEQIRMLAWHTAERLSHEKGEKMIKAMLRALMTDAEEAIFADGIRVRQKLVERKGYTVKPSSYVTIEAHIPADAKPDWVDGANVLKAG